jgi:hypothetical protein
MRSVMAVVAGYVVLAILIGVKFALLQQVAPGAFTSGAGLALIVLTDAMSAAAGGYVVALIARRRPVAHALALGAVMVPLGILNAVMNAGQEPLWFQVSVLAAIVVALPSGAWLQAATHAPRLEVASS